MNKTRAVLLVSIPVALGVPVACFDYSADPGAATTTTGGTLVTASNTSNTSNTSNASNTGNAANNSTTGGDGGIPLPCAILGDAGIPCVSAHSTVRSVVPGFSGALYQVQRSDGMTAEIGVVDGYADATAQDAFCAGMGCVISIIYDQSGVGNHLTPAPPGSAKATPGNPVNAEALPVTVGGHAAYGILIRPGMGYRAACDACPFPPGGPNGTAVGDEPQTMYMVSSQKDLINGCCFDYGNAERTANNDGNGTMEAVYLGQGVIWGTGSGDGPWVMADLENGLYPGWENGQDRNISTNTSLKYDFVTAVVIGDTADKNGGKGRFALYGGDAQAGELTTMYDGIRPEKPGYVPAQKQGSVILGIGGDNSDGDGGRFYEGVMANGVAPKEVVDALQAAIVAAGYGK